MDQKLTEMLKTLENEQPPEGLKARIFKNLTETQNAELNFIQRFAFINPLRAACIVSVIFSSLMWALFGNNYAMLVTALLQ